VVLFLAWLISLFASKTFNCTKFPNFSEICIYHRSLCLGKYFRPTLLVDDPDLPSVQEAFPSHVHFPLLEVTRNIDNITWVKGPALLLSLAQSVGNVYHFSEMVLNGWMLKLLNSDGLFESPHQYEHVLLFGWPQTDNDWVNVMLDMLFGHATRIWHSELARWVSHQSGGMGTICFETAVIPRAIPLLTMGARHSQALRAAMLSYLQLPDRSCHEDRCTPSKKVLFLNRPHHHGRGILNLGEVEELFHRMNIEHEVVDFTGLSMKEQVERVSESGVLVSPHGAGLTNLLWLPHGGVVIELEGSPLFAFELYKDIAVTNGIRHILVPPRAVEPQPDPSIDIVLCMKIPNCRLRERAKSIIVDLQLLETALNRSFAFIDLLDLHDYSRK